MAGRVGDDLRPDLRRREAPPAQARHVPRSAQARLHQRDGVRGLRRLRRQSNCVSVDAGRDRVRPQARDRPVDLQQGLFLPRRASARASSPSKAARCSKRKPAARVRDVLADAARAGLAGARAALRHPGHRHRRHRRHHHRRAARHGGAHRGQGRLGARHDRPGAEGRRGHQPRPHRRASPRTSTPCASPPARPTLLHRLRPRGRGRAATRSPRCAGTTRARSSTATRRSRRLHAPARPEIPRRRAARAGAGRGRRRTRVDFIDATHARDRAHGRLDRHQPVHARLRLPEGPGAAVGRGASTRRSSSTASRSRPTGRRSCGAGAPPSTARRSRRSPCRPRRMPADRTFARTLDEIVARRVAFLTAYQNAAYAGRYRALVRTVRAVEAPGRRAGRSSPRRSRATTS